MSLIKNPASILASADHPPVRLLDGAHSFLRVIPAPEAAQILARGSYRAHGSQKRIKSIMPDRSEINIRDARPGLPVCGVSVEWLRANAY